MKYSLSITVLAVASLVSAGPVTKRAAAITDVDILNYALTLEHLEDKFYREGLANYTQADFVAAGFADPFYANLMEVSKDETTHVSFLTSALGSAAVAECTYSFPSTDPASFVALSSVLEGVGVSAYLGAAALISNKAYLTDAGSILTVEARHSAYVRAALKESPFPQPFDAPLTLNEVYTLAAAFIVSCPSTNAALPVKAFPSLALGTTGLIKAGDTITLLTPGHHKSEKRSVVYAAFILVTGPVYADATPVKGGYTVTVPAEMTGMPNGQSYVVLTSKLSSGVEMVDNTSFGCASVGRFMYYTSLVIPISSDAL